MKTTLLLTATFLASTGFGQTKIQSAESQITTTLLACPDGFKDGAKILGYNPAGELVTLRDGNNGMICLADDPKKDKISVACYSDKLEAFMSRGRELVAEGKSNDEKDEIRGKEIDAGTLKMPSEPAAVYVVSAKQEDLNFETGELANSKIRYVFYKPYMTAEETGLTTKPAAPGMPWLMDAGTHRSHIMIVPPAKE